MRSLQKAFTLVELMITLVISLLLTYGIAQVLISSNQSSSTSDGVAQAQETGRFAMSYLANQVRQAGLDSLNTDTITTQAVIGCDIGALNAINACPFESNAGDTELTIDAPAPAISGDRFAVAWVPPAGETEDCTGNTIPGFAADDIIVNVFWVSFDATANSNSLFCQGHRFDGLNVLASGVPQAIANGVETMHVLYGEASNALPTNGERNANRYVNADQVANWNRVYAIKVAVMTRSLSDVTNNIVSRRYTLLDSGLYNFTDAVNRQVFSTTFSISNY